MASSRGPPGSASDSDLAAFERELDSEEFSLLHRPSSMGMSESPSTGRGESSVTPSTARIGSTRGVGGGLGLELAGHATLWSLLTNMTWGTFALAKLDHPLVSVSQSRNWG